MYRFNCVNKIIEGGHYNISDACRLLQFNRTTYYNICKRLENSPQGGGNKKHIPLNNTPKDNNIINTTADSEIWNKINNTVIK